MTRQRKYQLKMVAQGRCKICGKPAINTELCEAHRQADVVYHRELRRKKHHCKKRYYGAASYKFK